MTISEEGLLIRLEEKVDTIIKRLDCIDADKLEKRISVLEVKTETNENEIEKLRGKSDLWNGINSLGIAILSALGFLVK